MAKIICEIPRWQLLKAKLNNLNTKPFIDQYEATPEAVLLDVRTVDEFNDKHLPNATHLDYLDADFIDHLELLDKDKTYFVYCQSGRRSTRTCTLLRNSGFQHIFNLEGGLNEMNDT